MWHNSAMTLFLERFVLVIFAATFLALVVVNNLKFDWTQRITLGVFLVAGAYFTAHTIHRLRESPAAPVASPELSSEIGIRTRIAALIADGVKLQEQCQAIPDPYKTPYQQQPLLANALFQWKQRAQDVLSLDLDPEVLQKCKPQSSTRRRTMPRIHPLLPTVPS